MDLMCETRKTFTRLNARNANIFVNHFAEGDVQNRNLVQKKASALEAPTTGATTRTTPALNGGVTWTARGTTT